MDKDDEIAQLKAELESLKQVRVDGGISKLADHANREAIQSRTLSQGGDIHVPEIHDTAMQAAAHAFADWL